MSIVTLKRKSNILHGSSHSEKYLGFSLNGVHRNQGYIGQTSLSRSQARTPMKGTTPKGYGGNYGEYNKAPIINTVWTTEDSTTVKTSSINTHGMMQNRFRWARRPFPYAITGMENTVKLTEAQRYAKPETSTSAYINKYPCIFDDLSGNNSVNYCRAPLPSANDSSETVYVVHSQYTYT